MVEVIVWIFVILVSLIIFLVDKLIVANKRVKHQKYTIETQLADIRRMILELEEWENCMGYVIDNDAEKVLEMLDAKIKRAEAEKCFWEPRRLSLIKENYLKTLKNSAYEDKKVSGETAKK